MTRADRALRVATALGWLAAAGCTTLREIPRGEYAARPERRHVAVETQDGLRHKFDFVRFASDTLTGFRPRDTEGAFEEYDVLPIPLEAVARLSARRVDWYRTGLVGGGALAAIVVGVLVRRGAGTGTPRTSPCGPKGCPE